MRNLSLSKLFFTMGLIVMMIFIVACSDKEEETSGSEQNNNQNEENNTEENGENSTDEQEDPVEVEIVVNNYGRTFPDGLSENDNPYLDLIEENTNLDINVQIPPEEGYMERLNVIMASDELPDMIYSPDSSWFVNYVNQNALTPLKDIVEEHGQNLLELIPDEAWDAVTIDGEYYGIPHILQEAGTHIMYGRKDWLDELDLDEPETLDDYVNMLREFDENFDTVGLPITDSIGRIEPFLGAFGIQRGMWVERDGELEYSSIQPEMKDALQFLNDLYEEGLIDNEFTSNTVSVLNEKIANDKVGVFAAAWWDTRGPILTNQENNPDAEWISLNYPVGPNGDSGTAGSSLVRGYNTIPVTSDKAVEIVQMLDFIVSDGFRDIFLGFEGDVWEVVDGVASTDFEKHNEHLYRQMYTTVEPLDMETTKIRLDSLGLEFNLYDNVTKIAENVQTTDYTGPPTRSEGTYGGQLTSLEDEYFTRIIAGESSIDLFDEFVERWYAEGGQEWTDEVNEWFKSQ